MINISFFEKFNCLIYVFSFLLISGCATQGRLTSLTFNKSQSYQTLASSIEDIKAEYNGSLQEQVSALRVLRFISKHNSDPGKQEMALRALTFFAFASDDGDIRDRSKSRLISVLHSPDWGIHLKFSLIDSLVDLITGVLGFQEEHDGVKMNFGVSSRIRKDALKFLIDDFDSLTSEIQYYAVSGLQKFLLTPPSLENCPEDICDAEIRKNKEDWNLGKEVKNVIPANADPNAVEAGAYGAATKRVILDERKDWNEESDELKESLWEWIEDPLENLETEFLVQGKLIRLAGEIENFALQENIANDFIEQTKKWSENEDISIDLRQILFASREKVNLYNFPAKRSPKIKEKKYTKILGSPIPFLETHLDAILHEKLERQRSGFATGKPETIEMAFAVFEESDKGMLKREIVMENIKSILEKGLILNTRDLNKSIEKAIDRTRSQIELLPLMGMVREMYSSLNEQKKDPRPLFEILVVKMKSSENLFQKRIFLKTLLTGAKIFPTEVNLNLNIVSADEYDVVTQNYINSVMEEVQEAY